MPASRLGVDFSAQSQLQFPVWPDIAFSLHPFYTSLALPMKHKVINRAN